jgi:hypothetical protein
MSKEKCLHKFFFTTQAYLQNVQSFLCQGGKLCNFSKNRKKKQPATHLFAWPG